MYNRTKWQEMKWIPKHDPTVQLLTWDYLMRLPTYILIIFVLEINISHRKNSLLVYFVAFSDRIPGDCSKSLKHYSIVEFLRNWRPHIYV